MEYKVGDNVNIKVDEQNIINIDKINNTTQSEIDAYNMDIVMRITSRLVVERYVLN